MKAIRDTINGMRDESPHKKDLIAMLEHLELAAEAIQRREHATAYHHLSTLENRAMLAADIQKMKCGG